MDDCREAIRREVQLVEHGRLVRYAVLLQRLLHIERDERLVSIVSRVPHGLPRVAASMRIPFQITFPDLNNRFFDGHLQWNGIRTRMDARRLKRLP